MLNSHCQFVFCSIVIYLLTNRSDKRQLLIPLYGGKFTFVTCESSSYNLLVCGQSV